MASLIRWGDQSHPNFAEGGLTLGFGLPTMPGTYPEIDAAFCSPWLHLLVANGGFWIACLAVILAYGDKNLGGRRIAYLTNVGIFLELSVEMTLHIITGEIAAIHRIVDAVKVLVLVGMGLLHAIPAVASGPKDTLYYVTMAVGLAGAPATLLEVYVSYGADSGITALMVILAISLSFSALLKQAMADVEKIGSKID